LRSFSTVQGAKESRGRVNPYLKSEDAAGEDGFLEGEETNHVRREAARVSYWAEDRSDIEFATNNLPTYVLANKSSSSITETSSPLPTARPLLPHPYAFVSR